MRRSLSAAAGQAGIGDDHLDPLELLQVGVAGRGYHWGSEAHHPDLPRGARVRVGTIGTLEQILHGPSTVADGMLNMVGALRRTMATSGYSDLKEFQRVEVVVTSSTQPRR